MGLVMHDCLSVLLLQVVAFWVVRKDDDYMEVLILLNGFGYSIQVLEYDMDQGNKC